VRALFRLGPLVEKNLRIVLLHFLKGDLGDRKDLSPQGLLRTKSSGKELRKGGKISKLMRAKIIKQ